MADWMQNFNVNPVWSFVLGTDQGRRKVVVTLTFPPPEDEVYEYHLVLLTLNADATMPLRSAVVSPGVSGSVLVRYDPLLNRTFEQAVSLLEDVVGALITDTVEEWCAASQLHDNVQSIEIITDKVGVACLSQVFADDTDILCIPNYGHFFNRDGFGPGESFEMSGPTVPITSGSIIPTVTGEVVAGLESLRDLSLRDTQIHVTPHEVRIRNNPPEGE